MHLGDGRSFFLKNSWPQLGEEPRTSAAPLNSISQEEDDKAKWVTDKQGDPSIESSSSPHFFFLPPSTSSPALTRFIHNNKQDHELSIGSSLNRMITNHLLPDPWNTVAVGSALIRWQSRRRASGGLWLQRGKCDRQRKKERVGSAYSARPHS